jgi:hypothetical protein
LQNSLFDIYAIICEFNANSNMRTIYSQFRHKYLTPILVKNAFDTRRINQNTEFNPRRNLQYYQRSEPYIDDKTAEKIKLFFKVKVATDDIRNEFIGEPDWLDSYTRILCNAVDQTLRIDQKDCDYSGTQLDYLSELLYVRYRLEPSDILNASPTILRQTFLNKDEKLLRRGIFVNYKDDLQKNSNFYKQNVVQNDSLADKLFGDVKANKENKEVERSVTITIKDKIIDDIKN